MMIYGNLWVESNTWTLNSAVTSGGSIYAYQADVNIYDSTIADNSAPEGGGFYADTAADLYVYYTDFNDSSYFCSDDSHVALLCCIYPAWICGDLLFNDDCLPISNDVMTMGQLKQLYR